jgi:hypothetical protein
VRFINQLRIPFPMLSSHEFLREFPRPLTSPRDHAAMRGFAEQLISVDAPSGATVSLIRMIQEPAGGAAEAQAIIDVDPTFRYSRADYFRIRKL